MKSRHFSFNCMGGIRADATFPFQLLGEADLPKEKEAVNHPAHYGGADNPYEAIKVIEAWNLNFNLGNAVKYIARAGKKDDILQDLKKAAWYLNREIENLEVEKYED